MGVDNIQFDTSFRGADVHQASQAEAHLRVDNWTRLRIGRIEDLHDAVLGAGLDAMQLSSGPLDGSLDFAQRDGMLFSSGLINGHVALRGPLSQATVTLGIAISLPRSARHWLQEVSSGAVGLFM